MQAMNSEISIPLMRGIYIVKVAERVKKIVIE